VLLPLLLLLTGCGEKTGVIKCTGSAKDVVNKYETKSEYKINYKGDYVESVETVETVTSENEEFLKQMQDTVKELYDGYNKEYGGYTFDVSIKDDKLVSTVSIDYSKMDIDKFVKDQSVLKNYVKDGKLTVDGLKSMYTTMGATCE